MSPSLFRTRRLERWLPIALLIVVVLAAAWKLTLGDRAIARGDLLLYFYPLRDYAAQAVRELRLPLWNPYTFMGAPFLANSQVGFFYPFNLITAWLPVERAVAWNIALHLVIAALGAYALARRGFGLSRLAAFACGLTFSLGGYLGAQVEHLNQLQVLAWLPLAMVSILDVRFSTGTMATGAWVLRRTVLLSAIVALQLAAGHTQSLYISMVAVGLAAATQAASALWANRHSLDRPTVTRAFAPIGVVAASTLLAAAMVGVQLLPTLELSGESARAGGLPFNEAGAFSWRPWVIARALLPTFGDPLFAEYVAYLGAAGLALAVLGAWTAARPGQVAGGAGGSETRPYMTAVVLVIVGFVLALGVVTPVFNVLYRALPGFNLFRAQARWLALFALGMSVLVGVGVQALAGGLTQQRWRLWLLSWVALLATLLAGLVLGARVSPEAEYQSLPGRTVLLGWIVAVIVVSALIVLGWRRAQSPTMQAWLPVLFVGALAVELLVASQFQPYARASDRGAVTSLRPATAHLLADPSPTGERGRVLALSSLFFDPGDKAEQELIYGPQLSADEVYDRVIASKHKEVLSPNLPLMYRLPSVDGYDGGLLPTRRYAEYVTQFARTPTGAVDGRLREFLTGVPDDRWLSQMAVRHVIADKTQDIFIDGVYTDLLFSAPITSAGIAVPLRPYTATALGLVLSAAGAQAGDDVARATVTFDDGSSEEFTISARAPVTPHFGARLEWGAPRVAARVRFEGLSDGGAVGGASVRGITSIDATDRTFLSQSVVGEHAMRLVHSGDVKVYENQRPAPRALIRVDGRADYELDALGGAIVEDRPEFVRIRMPEATVRRIPDQPLSQVWPRVQLVLRDACHPGWVARVDGIAAPIDCVDVLFRAVDLPANAREVTFSYEPQELLSGAVLSLIGLTLWLCLLLTASSVGRARRASHHPQT